MGEIDQQSEQYRRGQVLGFTMAEIILVLLFLLLLLLGSKIERLSTELKSAFVSGAPEFSAANNLSDALGDLKDKNLITSDRDVEWLSERLVMVAELAVAVGGSLHIDDIQTLGGLKQRVDDLIAERKVLKNENASYKESLSKAGELQTQFSLDGELIEIVTDRKISSTEIRQCLLNCGGGPSACWGQSLAKPDFIYNVALYDDSLIVSPDLKSVERNLADWNALPPEARIEELTVMSTSNFQTAFSLLSRHANENDCKFQTRVVDVDTASKEIYKRQKKLADDFTYSTIFKEWDFGELPDSDSKATR